MKLSRSQAAEHLGISLSTFDRYVKAGKIKIEYGPENRLGKRTVWVDFPEIPEHSEELPRTSSKFEEIGGSSPNAEDVGGTSSKMLEPTDEEKRIASDLAFADLYRAGLATDSSGNTVNGTNERFPSKGIQSLLGPVERTEPRVPRTGTSHMDPALLSDAPDPTGAAPLIKAGGPQCGAGFTRSGAPLAAGYSQEQYNADMKAWRRSGGELSEGEKMQRQHVSAIRAAFPRAE